MFRIPLYSGGAEKLNLMLSPVAYMNKDQVHAAINTVIENIKPPPISCGHWTGKSLSAQVFNMLLAGVTCVKHEGFEEEREWRAIYMPKARGIALDDFFHRGHWGVPQIIYQIPLESVSPALAELDLVSMFDRLIVGPCHYPWAMYEAFADALAKAGVTDAGNRVRISEIPLRA